MSRILVTDLDGTLLGGDADDRLRLREALARHPEVTVVFATGRGPDSVRDVLRDPLVPRPRWIIADVGATLLDGADFSPVEPLQAQLRAGWPGPRRVRAALERFPALRYQDAVPQDGRCSYYLDPAGLTKELTSAVAELGLTWVYSGARYFDVLPPEASKGGALRALAEKLDWPPGSILVAGDSLNDLTLFGLGAHGVIVGDAEPAFDAAVGPDPLVHRPRLPGAAGILSALRSLGWVSPDGPLHHLLVGYHRPPPLLRPPASPNGILPTLSSAFADGLPGHWVAAATATTATTTVTDAPPTPPQPEQRLSLVPLTPEQWSGFVHRACKETLWPVLMSQPERSVFDPDAWAAYRAANARFAGHLAAHAAPGATVWLHDYNLWLVPGLLRAARPDLRVGLFHHTPFPAPEVFATLPVAAELRASLARLDWAGFHTAAFAEHFRRTLAGVPDLPRTGVHPLGVDRPAIEALVRSRTGPPRPTTGRLVLSVERLDYAKAPVQKVEALDRLLTERPELRRRLTFRLVCPPPEPGITAYDSTRALLERRIAEVNRRWQHCSWRPIDYLPTSLSFAEVVDEYLAADVFWVTSLQDGMNLTAKEFIAAQSARPGGDPGVLLLSRHAGAAAEFGAAALLTDPHSPEDLAARLADALAVTPAERRTRMERLSALLGDARPVDWATDVVRAIRRGR
ncbi:trehalose-6-phosphate synthase [Kitasatospora sp. NPDC004531]